MSEKDGKYVYIDETGEFVIAPKYYIAEPFRGELARVKTGMKGKWIFIGQNGKPAFKEKFNQAMDFSEGLARVLAEAEMS